MTGDIDLLSQAWEQREENLYPEVFGRRDTGRIFTLNDEVFQKQFGQQGADPRWLHCGVLVFPPVSGYRSYSIATSGLSNAWNAVKPTPDVPSGAGFELHLEVAEPEKWAMVALLSVMAHQLLVNAEIFTEGPSLRSEVVLPLGAPLVDGSELTHFLALPSPLHAGRLQLVTGFFELLLLVGLTDREAEYVLQNGWRSLSKKFEDRRDYVSTDPARRSVV